jgi:hypothetical protein
VPVYLLPVREDLLGLRRMIDFASSEAGPRPLPGLTRFCGNGDTG